MNSAKTHAFNLKALLVLALGHCVTDIYQGALPAILPLLKERFSLSYSMAGVILLASNVASSVVQPLFGIVSDREQRPWLLPAGCLLAGISFCLLPISSHFGAILFLVILSGLGISAFHPEGFKTAYLFTGSRAAVGMSVFSVGGNLGFALGPVVGLSIVTHLGFKMLPVMIVFSFVFLAALAVFWKTLSLSKTGHHHAIQKKQEKGRIITFSLVVLLCTVILRSWTHAGLTTYIPFYYINHLRGDPVYAGQLVTSFLMGGVVGTILGAPLADRWGHKPYLIFSMFAASLVMPIIFVAQGTWLMAVLFIFGMVLISTFTVTMVMAQRLLPHNLGIASGLMVGFAIGTGGIGVTLLGLLADRYGVPFAMKSIIVLPVLGAFFSLLVKYPDQKQA